MITKTLNFDFRLCVAASESIQLSEKKLLHHLLSLFHLVVTRNGGKVDTHIHRHFAIVWIQKVLDTSMCSETEFATKYETQFSTKCLVILPFRFTSVCVV